MIAPLDLYMKKIKKGVKAFTIYIQFMMTMGKDDESIHKKEFVQAFEDPKMQKLSTTQGVRELIYDWYRE